jgi:glycosyltransferase involved in cell wall biosynthesis
MPVKNAGAYLDACIQSVRFQDVSDWELIAVNDHSTDYSLELLKRHALEDRRIKVLENPGNGIIPALREALEASDGKWISRMDADDIMLPSKMRSLRNLLQGSGPGYLATAYVEMFSETPMQEGFLAYAKWLNHLSETGSHYSARYTECVIPSPNWMLSKADLISIGGFDSDWYPEDYDLCFRCYEGNIRIATVKEVLHRWRDHSKRASRTDAKYADQNFFELKLFHFLKSELQTDRQLVLWGAGKKGKTLAKLLIKQNVDFHWTTENIKKVGHTIYGKRLQLNGSETISARAVRIIAISSPLEKTAIKTQLINENQKENVDFYFFC